MKKIIFILTMMFAASAFAVKPPPIPKYCIDNPKLKACNMTLEEKRNPSEYTKTMIRIRQYRRGIRGTRLRW